MAQPGTTTHRVIRVQSAAGAAVTGLVTANFTFTGYQRAFTASVWSTYTTSAAITEIGSGLYALAFVLPAAAGWFDFYITPDDATRVVFSDHFEGEVESQDLDSIYANVVRTAAIPSGNNLIGTEVAGELVAYRYNQWSIAIVDQSGAAVDLSTYTSLALSVRTTNQTTKKLDATDGSPTGFGLSGSALGILTITWPESTGTLASAADIYDEPGRDLFYEVVGNLGGDAAKTVPIIRSSPLTILRREVGS
jgi:hypothetical protein